MTKDETKKGLSQAIAEPNSYRTLISTANAIQKIAIVVLCIGVIMAISSLKESKAIAIATIIEFTINASIIYGVSAIVSGISEIVFNTYATRRLLELQINADNELD